MRTRWGLQVMLGVALTGLAGATPGVGAHQATPRTSFTVHVRNYAQVDAQTLTEAEKVATHIFRQAGVGMQTVAASTTISEVKEAEGQPQFGLSHLWLSIIPGHMAGLHANVMGLAPGTGPDRRVVYVFYESVETLAQRQLLDMHKGDIIRPATKSQILGHMIAHEVGHLLLNLPLHAPSGVMHGDWDLKDLQDAAYGSLFFTKREAAVLRAEVTRRAQAEPAMNPSEPAEPARFGLGKSFRPPGVLHQALANSKSIYVPTH